MPTGPLDCQCRVVSTAGKALAWAAYFRKLLTLLLALSTPSGLAMSGVSSFSPGLCPAAYTCLTGVWYHAAAPVPEVGAVMATAATAAVVGTSQASVRRTRI